MRYIPQNYELVVKDERYGFEVWRDKNPERICAIAFGGKRSKPDWHYRFNTEARLLEKIQETLKGLIDAQERKEARKKERNAPHDVKVGDIFVCSWGYDQTNIDYYQCTRVFGAMIEVREIGAMHEETEFMSGRCVPAQDHFIGEPMRKKVSVWNGEPSVRIYSFASASRLKPAKEIGNAKVYPSHSWSAYA